MSKCDPLWYSNPSILYSSNRLVQFYPSPDMCLNEKMNAIVRFSFYFAFIMICLQQNINYIAIPVGCMIISYIVHLGEKEEKDIIDKFYSEEKCVKPTKDNPLMNYNIITDNPKRPEACKSYEKKIEEDITDKFYDNNQMYMSVDEALNLKNQERQFYTMPVSKSMSDQKEFAEWCYGTPDTCKEGNNSACQYRMRLQNNVNSGFR